MKLLFPPMFYFLPQNTELCDKLNLMIQQHSQVSPLSHAFLDHQGYTPTHVDSVLRDAALSTAERRNVSISQTSRIGAKGINLAAGLVPKED